ncbi:MAG: aminotransferase class I/II-fold pyridoxal phosphate-dependent enzyme [Flammeovirgaceae bacterium]|nr:MAG: aminotransferase class I/II-fold pyridoxal phosphate-dependent enzyme [Flammeovirgaceae bacterium]
MDKSKIWLSPPHMGGEEIKFVQEAFDTNWVSPVGPHITAFESELSSYLGIADCAALSSGTAAIHLALIILGIQRDDEVICSTFTFSGSCNPVVYLGAKPVFVDSESLTWNMDPDLLEEAIRHRISKTGKKPKAIILVHLYGMPAQLDRIMNIAKQYEIPVIEDAAEALGAEYKGKKVGTFGDIGILSFNGNKIITTSGGGALVSDNIGYVKRARFLATQAREPVLHYEHKEIGYNYRLSNISAGIGRGQLKFLDQRVRRRREIFEFYSDKLSPYFDFIPEPAGHYSNRWLTTAVLKEVRLKSVVQLQRALEIEQIECRPLWKPMHLQPVYAQTAHYSNGTAESLFNKGICLPSGSNLIINDLNRICEVLSVFLIKQIGSF